ncbi:MAG: helix-turn-helix transcriptional regulator [Bacteroidota bacterium]
MKGTFIGELEELVMLTAAALKDDAYGVAIVAEIKETTGREMNIGAIHTVLRRLEDKGLLKSRLGGATNERGGRRKRIYTLTHAGQVTLDQVYEIRSSLYKRIRPSMS